MVSARVGLRVRVRVRVPLTSNGFPPSNDDIFALSRALLLNPARLCCMLEPLGGEFEALLSAASSPALRGEGEGLVIPGGVELFDGTKVAIGSASISDMKWSTRCCVGEGRGGEAGSGWLRGGTRMKPW